MRAFHARNAILATDNNWSSALAGLALLGLVALAGAGGAAAGARVFLVDGAAGATAGDCIRVVNAASCVAIACRAALVW